MKKYFNQLPGDIAHAAKNVSWPLSAEIEARRKQYEYYRNKLLSFKNLND
jgi:restriction endonuclease S subunit